MSQALQDGIEPAGVTGGATYELRVAEAIGSTPQQVLDESGSAAPLYLGTAMVVVGNSGQTPNPGVFHVQGNVGRGNLITLYNSNPQQDQSPEASMRFMNASDQGGWWHMGVGGKPGPMTFFLWNSHFSPQQVPALTIDQAGNMTVQGTVTANGGIALGPSTTLNNLPPVESAEPGAELAAVVLDKTTGKLYSL